MVPFYSAIDIFLDYFGQLKQLAKNPTADNCKVVLQEIPNNRHLRDHFFKEIENFSAWLPMLKSKNVFEDVPYKYASDDGYVITQPWPPLDFLIRIVEESNDYKTLKQVADIAFCIPETKNARVNIDLLDLAAKLPAQLSSELMPRIMSALNSEGLYLMGDMISGLLIKFNEAGFKENLLEISEKVIFDEKFNPYFKDTYIGNNTDFYFYDSLLTVLSGFNHKDILRLLHDRALEGLSLTYEDNHHEKYNTMYWTHVFDDEVENDGLALMYVSKLFLSIKNLMSSSNATLEEIVIMLSEGNKEKNWHIIDALILKILETYDEQQTYDSYRIDLHNKLADYEENRRNRGESQAIRSNHVSPYSEEELSSLTAIDVLERLRKYEGPVVDDYFNESPSRIGLRQCVERQIKQRPKEFVECLEVFMKLENDDCANLICSFTQADFVSDTVFEKAYLALINEFIENRYDFSSEQNRRNFSQSVCRIFRKIYSSPDCYLRLNGFAFKALDKIINDKSISSAILSSTRVNRFHELALHALNTPFVEAFGCFLDCYLTPDTKWKDIRSREDIDAFKSYILSSVRVNASASFCFKLGQKIYLLHALDEKWFVCNLKNIVLNNYPNELWEAFIAGVMEQRFICNDFLDDIYRNAIRHVSTEEYLSNPYERDDFSIEKGIAKHISFFYCQLDEQNCKADSLTNFIFVHGSLPLKRAFLSKADYQLKKDDCPVNAFYKIKELIDWRYEELGKTNFASDRTSELTGFFVLFPSLVKFDPEWSLRYLCEFMTLFELNDQSSYQFSIIDSLVGQAERFPFLTAQSLLSLVKHSKKNLHYFSRLKMLIEALHHHGRDDTHSILKEVVSRLSSKGICPELTELFSGARLTISGQP